MYGMGVAVSEEIRFAATPTYQRVYAGSGPLLPCRATGQPPPTISWRFNRKKIPNVGKTAVRRRRRHGSVAVVVQTAVGL